MQNVAPLIIDEEMKLQANMDIATRSKTGAYIYLVIWFAIIIPEKLYQTNPVTCLWFTSLLVVFAFLRFLLIKNFSRIYSRSPHTWQFLLYPLIWATGLLWGLLCSASLIYPVLNSMAFITLVTTAGLTSGGSTALAPSRVLTIGLITALLIPGGMTMLFFKTNFNISVFFFFFIYWIGMYAVTKHQHDEYWTSLKHSFVIKRYADELEQLNTLDGLTGLKNRAYFDDSFKKELKQSIREQYDLSLMIMDIDHFKTVNDRFGHLIGDDCLKLLSSLLISQIKRETDTVARFGGEEFAVILPGTNSSHALSIAETIRQSVEKINLDTPEGKVRFTVSIGVSSMIPKPGISDKDMITSADKALYESKKSGRNLVTIAMP